MINEIENLLLHVTQIESIFCKKVPKVKGSCQNGQLNKCQKLHKKLPKSGVFPRASRSFIHVISVCTIYLDPSCSLIESSYYIINAISAAESSESPQLLCKVYSIAAIHMKERLPFVFSYPLSVSLYASQLCDG